MIEIVGRIEGEVKLSDEKNQLTVKVTKQKLVDEISEIEKLVRNEEVQKEIEIIKAWVCGVYAIYLRKQRGVIELYFTPEKFWRRRTKGADATIKDNVKVYNMLAKIIEDKQKNQKRITRESIY